MKTIRITHQGHRNVLGILTARSCLYLRLSLRSALSLSAPFVDLTLRPVSHHASHTSSCQNRHVLIAQYPELLSQRGQLSLKRFVAFVLPQRQCIPLQTQLTFLKKRLLASFSRVLHLSSCRFGCSYGPEVSASREATKATHSPCSHDQVSSRPLRRCVRFIAWCGRWMTCQCYQWDKSYI